MTSKFEISRESKWSHDPKISNGGAKLISEFDIANWLILIAIAMFDSLNMSHII